MCGRNGLDVGWFGSSGRDMRNDMVVVDRNGMVKRSGICAERNDIDIECNESDLDCKESNVDHTGRDVVRKEY